MAKKETVYLIDDIDGSNAETEIKFAIDGTAYVIDLNAAHAAAFNETLRPFISRARRISPDGSRIVKTGPKRSQSDKDRDKAIRAWARTRAGRKILGIKPAASIPNRGRIPNAWKLAYQARNNL
jgi:hypothetical protein